MIDDDTYSPKEAARRRDKVIKLMLNTPPKPHSEMQKPSPAAKGRPKKQPPQSGAED